MGFQAAKLPAGYKPTEKEEYMNDKQLSYFWHKLKSWREELIKESAETKSVTLMSRLMSASTRCGQHNILNITSHSAG